MGHPVRLATLYRRSLAHHWRMGLATIACAAVAVAVLTGALMVGDSMRGSLRDRALARLGPFDAAFVFPQFVRETFAEGNGPRPGPSFRLCPAMVLQGTVEKVDAQCSGGQVNIFGVDERFWEMTGLRAAEAGDGRNPRGAVLNQPLAALLGARVGEEILVRLRRPDDVSPETLLGRRDDTMTALRLTVDSVVPANGPGGLALRPTQYDVYNVFVPLAAMQRSLKRVGQVNTVLLGGIPAHQWSRSGFVPWLCHAAEDNLALSDLGLSIRNDAGRNTIVVESERLLIPPAAEAAVRELATEHHTSAMPVLVYLANSIAIERPGRADTQPAVAAEISYSIVAALDPAAGAKELPMPLLDGRPAPAIDEGEILLNEWAAQELHANVGDRVRLTYYVAAPFGRLETREAAFTLRGIVRREGLAADRGLTPPYKGVTDARRLRDWDPPFPIDFRRIGDRDEVYWDKYGPTPKAFVSLTTGQRLWTQANARFGRLTSIRMAPPPDQDIEEILLRRLGPEMVRAAFRPLRTEAIAAAEGSTDFGTLFAAFSFFLIVSAAILTALTFRLGVERRASEAGILLATGFSRRLVTRLLMAEGIGLALAGSAAGIAGAVGYAALMLAGLRSRGHVFGASFLHLDVCASTLIIGFLAGLPVVILSIGWAARGLTRRSPRSLLAGEAPSAQHGGARRGTRGPAVTAIAFATAAAILIALSAGHVIPRPPAFFASGTALLIAAMAALLLWCRLPSRGSITGRGWRAIGRLGVRNAVRNPARTLLAAGLVACATFVIVAVGASRPVGPTAPEERGSGTGGFRLMAESAIPVLCDLNTPEGRRDMALSPAAQATFAAAIVVPFRLRSGDDASCASLYRPDQPRILGAARAMIDRGGFAFHSSLARTDAQKRNPWLLLEEALHDGAVPAIGDAATVMWMLHLGLGKDLIVRDESGRDVRVRFVGLLAGSILQGEVVIAEPRFVEMFPSESGYRFFLIDVSGEAAERVSQALTSDVRRYGFETTSTVARLARFASIEGVYMAAFQSLGGLGLLLGTLGLTAVLLRNALERRREAALLIALGYSRPDLRRLIIAEHGGVLGAGLVAGTVAGLLAVAPHIAAHVRAVPWATLGVTLVLVPAAGWVSLYVASAALVRVAGASALRDE